WPRADLLPRPPSSVPKMRSLEGMRVLIIEDDAAVTQLLESALEARGADVTIARALVELDSAVRAGPHDVALLDLSPIAADPKRAISALRAASPEAALVVITGSADGVPEELADGKATLVRKPFEIAEIVFAISCASPSANLDRALAGAKMRTPGTF